MVEFLSAAIWDRVCRYLRGRGLIFFPKFNTKTTITHLSWRAEEDELMMSEASFRALDAENNCVLITRSLSNIISPFCSPSASMTLALACLEAEIKMKYKLP